MTQHDPDPYEHHGSNGDAPPDPAHAERLHETDGQYYPDAGVAEDDDAELTRAAIGAKKGTTHPDWRPPKTWLILGLIVVLMAGLTIYIFGFYLPGLQVNREKIRLRVLSEQETTLTPAEQSELTRLRQKYWGDERVRLRMLSAQETTWYDNERYRRLYPGMQPPNEVVKPLTEAEQADLARLRQKFGVKPPEREPLPPPPRKAPTRPATAPATQPEASSPSRAALTRLPSPAHASVA